MMKMTANPATDSLSQSDHLSLPPSALLIHPVELTTTNQGCKGRANIKKKLFNLQKNLP